jgi:proteasome accessory factor A
MTACEIQRGYCELAGEFVSAGMAEKTVPHSEVIIRDWSGMLDWLVRRDREALARRSDAWQKYLLLDRFRGRRNLSWQSPELRVLDLLFSSTDPDESLFFKMAADGQVENMPDDATIEHYADEPPDDTRAWLRAHLLRQYGEDVSAMDWGWIRFRIPRRSWYSVAEVTLDDPRRFGRDECTLLLADAPSVEEVVNRLSEATVPLQEIPSWNASAPHTSLRSPSAMGPPSRPAIPWTAPVND